MIEVVVPALMPGFAVGGDVGDVVEGLEEVLSCGKVGGPDCVCAADAVAF